MVAEGPFPFRVDGDFLDVSIDFYYEVICTLVLGWIDLVFFFRSWWVELEKTGPKHVERRKYHVQPPNLWSA